MDSILITGGKRLRGTVRIAGAKNSCLALMPLCLLCEDVLHLANAPTLSDITMMARLLRTLGCRIDHDPGAHSLTLQSAAVPDTVAEYDIVRKMRASFLVLGPLLARTGAARVSLPGGCAIGARGVDLHLSAMTTLGADVTLQDGYVRARAPRGLVGGTITFPSISVGATENAMMAAVLARGRTEIVNAAREPEIIDLGTCLAAMGARIDGLGSGTITIDGVRTLHGCRHRVVHDRIELGTYMLAAAMTGGEVEFDGVDAGLLAALVTVLDRMGVDVAASRTGIRVSCRQQPLNPVDVTTAPYPGFPTDLQAQLMATLSLAAGESLISETIFESRFMHVPELRRMGARIELDGRAARIQGVGRLIGAPVMATDLRASVALVLAGLAAEGLTRINRVYHLDRGYEDVEDKLNACGAEIRRVAS